MDGVTIGADDDPTYVASLQAKSGTCCHFGRGQRSVLIHREGRTALVTKWALSAALKQFGGKESRPFDDAVNRKTAGMILDAYSDASGPPPGDLASMKALLAQRYDENTIALGFSRLKACRTVAKYRDNPLFLAAAEHYTFMRYEASQSGDTELRRLPQLYYGTKVKLFKDGKETRIQQNDLPLSPPSVGIVEWGNLGVEDGLLDYANLNGKTPSKGTNAQGYIDQMNSAINYEIVGVTYRLFENLLIDRNNLACVLADP
ncbi:hypothetical protein [Mesorhizobium sp. CN2-181]|uniref:hypothetical protein n=1 Tax=Mesorhizobium yinganensis TaxID=3157707 RepID=UPI0032B74E9E